MARAYPGAVTAALQKSGSKPAASAVGLLPPGIDMEAASGYHESMDDDSDQTYKHSNGAVYLLRLHFIWVPRRRRAVLIGPVAERLETLLRAQAAALDLAVLRLAIQPDHVHLFLGVDPKIARAQITFRLKGAMSRMLRQEFPHLRRMPSMGTTSYFVSSAGNVAAATIDRYVQAQSTRA